MKFQSMDRGWLWLVFAVLSLGSFAWGQTILPKDFELKLDANGHIPPEFWSYEVPFTPVTQKMTFITLPVELLKQKPVDTDPEDNDPDSPEYQQNKKLVDSILQSLQQQGVTLDEGARWQPPEKEVGQFKTRQLSKSNLYSWSSNGEDFLINPLNPKQLVLLNYTPGPTDEEDRYPVKMQVQRLSSDIYRVICDLEASMEGCGAGSKKWLTIFDVNFKQGTMVRVDFPDVSWSEDLNKDGNIEAIVAPGIYELGCLPWVYVWDGGKWADHRGEFYNAYLDGRLKVLNFCGGWDKPQILEAVNKAIKAGEPLKYWK